MPATAEIQQRREDLVREHMESENRHEFDVTLGTFDHPRYELVGTGDVYDGPEEVMAYFEETRTAFPDQRNELLELHHAEDAVIVEAMLFGTHDGPLRGLPPTGRSFEMRFCAVFVFEEDRLVCERVYFDPNKILRDSASPTTRPAPPAVSKLWRAIRSRSARLCFAEYPAARPPAHFSSRESRRSLSTRPPVCSSGQ